MSGGVTGVVALGVFGEAAQLTPAERAVVVAEVAAAAPGVSMVVGLSSRETSKACQEAVESVEAGGDAVCAVMAQVNSTSVDSLHAHVVAIEAACGLPVVLQDYPAISDVHVKPATLISVLERGAPVAAIKVESPPTALAVAELAARVHTPLFGGLGGAGLLDELLSGAAGAMTGFSRPSVLVAALEAWNAGGFAAAREVLSPWLAMIAFESQARIGIALRKDSLLRQGVLRSASVRPPGQSFPGAMTRHAAAHQEAALDVLRSAEAVGVPSRSGAES